MENYIPQLTGGAYFRCGFEYIHHTRLNKKAFLLTFRFNSAQSYSLEFTDKYMRVFKNGGVVLETAKTVTGITAANPGVVTSATHGFATGDEVYFSGIVGMTDLNGQFYLVVRIDADTFSLKDIDGTAIDTTSFTAYSSGGTVARIYEVATPYLEADLWQLKYSSNADIAYIVHPSYEPRKLIRYGHASWTLGTYDRLMVSKIPTAITKASPGVITCATHGFVSGDKITFRNLTGMTELNNNYYLVVWVDANSFSLTTLAGVAVNTTSYSTFFSGGTVTKLFEAPKTITGITRANPGVVTSAAHGFLTYDKVYMYDVVGMTEVNTNYYWVKKIDANTFSLTDEFGTDINTTAFTAYTSGGKVALVSMPFTKINTFPAAVGFYGGRLYFGGSNDDPDIFNGSRGSDTSTGASQYDNFTVGTGATDAISYTIQPQNLATSIKCLWFGGTPAFLVIGTTGGIFKCNGGADGSAITPTAVQVLPISSYAAADINQIFVGNQLAYVESGNRTLRSFEYDLLNDNYYAFDKNMLAGEITYPGITQIAVSQGRPDLIWGVRSDGVLLSCTFLSKEEVAGWAKQKLGGDGVVLSVVAEPQSNNFDRIVICVEREIDGHTRRYIEYSSIDPQIPDKSEYYTGAEYLVTDDEVYRKIMFELQKQYIRMDSALVLDMTQTIALTLSAVSGTAVTVTAASALFSATDVDKYIFMKYLTGLEAGVAKITGFTSDTIVTAQVLQTFSSVTVAASNWYLTTETVNGLGHLEGETVDILTDGGVYGQETVSDGSITLDYPARYIIVGLKYRGFIRTLDLTFGEDISTIGAVKNLVKLYLRLRNTLGGKYGSTSKGMYVLEEAAYRNSYSDYTDRPPLLYSGLKELSNFDNWAEEKRLYIMQDQPLPMTILSMVPIFDITTES